MIVATAKLRLTVLLAALALPLVMLTLLAALARLTRALLPATRIVLLTTLLALVWIVLRFALTVLILTALLTVALLLVLVVLVAGIVGHDVLLVAGSRLNVFGGSWFRCNVAETPPQRSTCANLPREGSEGLRLRLTEGFVSGPAGPVPGRALPP
jgi:hypothetical protein